MPDILSQGGGREAGPWPRRLVVIALVALVAVAIVHDLPRSPHGTPRSVQAAATFPPLPASLPLAESGDAGVAAEPGGITGQTSAWPGGLRLPVTGPRPAWFWPATGQLVAIGGLPSQQFGYQFIRVAGGWAVQADPGAQTVCGSCAGPPRAVYFLADAASSVTRVGQADEVAPGVAGALWLTSYPASADPHTAVGLARDVSAAGRPLGPQLSLPAGYLIQQGTDRGLLLAPVAQQPGMTADKLWDPAASGASSWAASRSFVSVIAAGPTHIAWAPLCVERCRVQVLNLATGRQVSVGLPVASSVSSASFSPDGDLVAIELGFSDDSSDGARAVQLEVASTASGHLTTVPQSWVSSNALAGFGWPASGDSLVAKLIFTTKVQLAAWRPGASRLAITALGPKHSSTSLVIGP